MACFDVWDIGACGCIPPGVTCVTCSGIPTTIPNTLSITDALGTYTATWDSGLSLWVTPGLCSTQLSPIAKCTAGAIVCNTTTKTGGVRYTYSIECTSANHMTIKRYWTELTCAHPTTQYEPCEGSFGCPIGGATGGTQCYSSSGSVAVTCGAISWSGSLTKITGSLVDPVINPVGFSQ